MLGNHVALMVGACLGGGALLLTARWPRAGVPAPHAAQTRGEDLAPPGAGMALAGVLGEPGVL